ncbi:hypothetical protein [Dyadobacter psychrotolerans]|uniref:Uncharacterized protein n=1 Tax=Dyadobacter psychrotolerans TaxID=2541721 RepID=A0A4R5DMR1_9BACT|nr:hypothetical protein [Dyadobacter psychrotolerans]TDE11983.1 hypothetical protein E0F88_23290 [Dyadobacter psychrotolerans]
MITTLKILGVILGSMILVLSIFIFIFIYFGDAGCGNEIYQTIYSPDHLKKVLVYDRDCGAITGFSTHVTLLDTSEATSSGGNLFVADSDHGRAKAHEQYQTLIDIQVLWINDRTLEIEYDGKARVFTKVDQLADIDIIYIKK